MMGNGRIHIYTASKQDCLIQQKAHLASGTIGAAKDLAQVGKAQDWHSGVRKVYIRLDSSTLDRNWWEIKGTL